VGEGVPPGQHKRQCCSQPDLKLQYASKRDRPQLGIEFLQPRHVGEMRIWKVFIGAEAA
jgi:hypothetical protein